MNENQWAQLETFLLSERDLCTSTTDKTLRFVRILEEHGFDPLRPSRRAYNAFLAARKRQGKTGPGLRHYGRAVGHVLAWRGKTFPGFRLPRVQWTERRLLPDQVVAALLDYAQGRDELETTHARFAFRLGFYACLRAPSELADLELADHDRDARTLRVFSEKTETYETVHLEPWLSTMIADYVDGPRRDICKGRPTALLLDPYYRRPFVSHAAFGMWLGRCGRRVHPTFRPSDLRHAGGTWFYLETNDIYKTRDRLRQKSVRSTEYYVHVAERIRARRLAAANVKPYQLGALA